MIQGKNNIQLMDSHLVGKFSMEEATTVVNLASQCLQHEPRERPNIKDIVATLVPLQTKSDVSISSTHPCSFCCSRFELHSCYVTKV